MTVNVSLFNVLFLCTGNSCRSQMAEGWGRALGNNGIRFFSAGIEKHGLNECAVQVMAERGIDISQHQSKTLEDLKEVEFDLVYTVCSHADQTCPSFIGSGRIIHAPFDDPPNMPVIGDDPLCHYRRVRDQIGQFVAELPGSIEKIFAE